MKDSKDVLQKHSMRRREFITKSAKIAAAAPAVSLLLSQSSLVHAGLSGTGNGDGSTVPTRQPPG